MGLDLSIVPIATEGNVSPRRAERPGDNPNARPEEPNVFGPPSPKNTDAITSLLDSIGASRTVGTVTSQPIGRAVQQTLPQVSSDIQANAGGSVGVSKRSSSSGRRGPGYHTPVNPGLVDMIGEHGKQIMAAVGKPNEAAGQWRDPDVRPPGGAKFSYHHDGLALDIGLDAGNQRESYIGDRLAAWARSNMGEGKPFRQVIWKQAHHYDHVHLTYNPDYTGPLPAIPKF
jgi:hypothetical protein